jgi:hypothetical protein
MSKHGDFLPEKINRGGYLDSTISLFNGKPQVSAASREIVSYGLPLNDFREIAGPLSAVYLSL